MPDAARLLTLQFLDWVATRPRTYAEVMDAWRSSCPRLSIWEDALGDGLVRVEAGVTRNESRVSLTPRGRTLLTAGAQLVPARDSVTATARSVKLQQG